MTPAGATSQAEIAAFLREAPSGSVIGVFGMPGTGKSRAVQLADKAGCFARRVVFDPLADTDWKALDRGEEAFPYPGLYVSPAELAAEPELLDAERLRLVVAPLDPKNGKRLGREFDALLDLVWHTGGIDVIGEEAALYSRDAIGGILRLASGGRHVRSRLVMVCQSIGRLTIDARRHLSHVIVFAQGEPTDLQALRERCGVRFAAGVQQLRKGDGKCLFWRLGDATE